MEFLDENNICGQTLLRLVSRGSAIIAELLRLAEHIPAPLLPGSPEENPAAAKYAPILIDFRYLKNPEMFDKKVNTSGELGELDEEFFTTYEEVLCRFYKLFESIVKYIQDYHRYLNELMEGFYIQNTLEDVLLDMDGKQLICETLYLHGAMLLLMDARVQGPVREKLVIAYYRHRGEGINVAFEDVVKLARDTGYVNPYTMGTRGGATLAAALGGGGGGAGGEAGSAPPPTAGIIRPANYPEDMFARFPPPAKVVKMALARLRSDDVYNQTRVYPDPDHRSVALSGQASLLYVTLYFSPRTLHEDRGGMREAVDKHFSDNWVIPVYMGTLADLTVEWSRYKAAKDALGLDAPHLARVKELVARQDAVLKGADRQLRAYLTEGTLTETFVVDNIASIMDTLRAANTALRWALLHRRSEQRKWWEAVTAPPGCFADRRALLDVMMRTAVLESKLKTHIKRLLQLKPAKWAEDKAHAAGMMDELGDYFSGSRVLTRVQRDDSLMTWFQTLSAEMKALDYNDAVTAGRKIRQLITALDKVVEYDSIDSTPFAKDFLDQAKALLTDMVRTVNVTDVLSSDVDAVSDMSFAWELIRDYVGDMHEVIRSDPSSVARLRTVFLKLASVLDVPMFRIHQAGSADAPSVAEYYSNELVAFLRRVLEVIPVVVFAILRDIVTLQTRDMRPVPTRLEAADLRAFAQLEQRSRLGVQTHSISMFTEGVLAMEKTLLGVIQVNPRAVLHAGIRTHLVNQVSLALHHQLVFDLRSGRGRDPKSAIEERLSGLCAHLDGMRRSFEYVQDYVGVYGLQMWHQEAARIFGFNTEQECNKYLRRRILPDDSKYQSRDVPLPLFPRPPAGDTSGQVTFMGRLLHALKSLTDPAKTVYGPGALGGTWYDPTGREVAGLALFNLLASTVGVPGLTGLDRLLGFSIAADLATGFRCFGAEVRAGAGGLLTALARDLHPVTSTVPGQAKAFASIVKRLSKPMDALLDVVLRAGQAQLLRRAVSHELRFGCTLGSNLLFGALEAINASLMSDIRRHYHDPDTHPTPTDTAQSGLLPAVAKYCEAAGLIDPLTHVYILPEPTPHLGLWLALFAVAHAAKFTFDRDFGTLVRKKPTDGVDGAPFVAGLVTLLKQVHPAVTSDWLGYMGQYIRSSLSSSYSSGGSGGKPPAISTETWLLVLLVHQVATVGHIPRRVLLAHIPAYLFDTVAPPA